MTRKRGENLGESAIAEVQRGDSVRDGEVNSMKGW